MKWRMRVHCATQPDLTHEEILAVHTKLHEQGLLRAVFYDGTCRTPKEFVQFMRNPATINYVVYDEETEPAAIWWLADFSGAAARINFCVFRDFFPDALDIGKNVCYICLGGEKPYLRALYGVTPKCNRAALSFIEKLGFRRLAELPHAIDFNGRTVPGVLTIKEINNGW